MRLADTNWITLVFFAYTIVTQDNVILFVDGDKLDDDTRKCLGNTVDVKPYDSFFPYLKDISVTLELNKDAVSFISRLLVALIFITNEHTANFT
jgi:hypothetical protein